MDDIAEAFRCAPLLAASRTDPNRVLKCPFCSSGMELERLYGVAVDVCPRHGIWFDAGEAQLLINRVQSGERGSARQAIAEARRNGKWSAMFFGIWSFFLQDD
jgi:Zn-finger nucleic acid-binding protein